MLKLLLYAIFVCFIPLFEASALVKEVELPLISYHINNNATYKDAPNKIDSNAVFVLNPGLLIGLDTRKDTKTEGLSFIAKGGFLQDCANKTVFALGGGGRYRHLISDKLSLDINGYLMGANAVTDFSQKQTLCTSNPFTGQTCQTVGGSDKREFVVLPLINFGLNYHLKSGKTVGTTVSYIPKNTAIAATSGSDLLFFTVNFGF
jgi:hypothetical protein